MSQGIMNFFIEKSFPNRSNNSNSKQNIVRALFAHFSEYFIFTREKSRIIAYSRNLLSIRSGVRAPPESPFQIPFSPKNSNSLPRKIDESPRHEIATKVVEFCPILHENRASIRTKFAHFIPFLLRFDALDIPNQTSIICACPTCQDSDSPCHHDCDTDDLCQGCEELKWERQEIQHEIDQQQGLGGQGVWHASERSNRSCFAMRNCLL